MRYDTEKLIEDIQAFHELCHVLHAVDDLFKPAAGLLEESEELRNCFTESFGETIDESTED